jgi:hypothetical protein
MFEKRQPQICDTCLHKGGSGSDPDLDSRTHHGYGDFHICFDDDY